MKAMRHATMFVGLAMSAQLLLADSGEPPTYPIEKYKTAARAAYENVKPYFDPKRESYNYWRLGNVFDTMLDYLLLSGDDPDGIIKTVYNTYKQIKDDGCWYDDFAWWGIASAKAYDDRYNPIFHPHRLDFQKVAKHCWHVMDKGKTGLSYNYEGAPNVWANRDNGNHFPAYFTTPEHWAMPRIDGGVWQYDMFHKYRPKDEECSAGAHVDPADPTKPGIRLGPFQDSVVNGLYLVLALRLQAAGVIIHQDPGGREYDFLKDWFFLKIPGTAKLDSEHALLNQFGDPMGGKALVRERISTYALCTECTTSYPKVQAYNPDASWAGDQGLMLGGLVDYHAMHPGDWISQNVADWLVEGVATHLTIDDVVQPTTAVWPAGDMPDYVSGSGVFWRYLLDAYQKNSEVQSLVKQPSFQEVVYKSAEAALDAQQDSLFASFNVLSVLTTAVYVLEGGGF